jgi:formylglycine-generating enzyme required for sulfatase activity
MDDRWQTFTLWGMQQLEPEEPVCHVSFYEADAFARWKSETFAGDKDIRLPGEREWENAARSLSLPTTPHRSAAIADLHGVLWQWTASYYEPYPGYRPFPGALAEYNGKFMDNQRVLRGGSFVTPPDHYRLSYRNFWPAPTRFQFTGIRLASAL